MDEVKKILKSKEAIIPFLIFLLAFLIRIVYFLRFGVTLGGDSRFYQSSAASILQKGISYYLTSDSLSHFYYWGYPTFLAFIMHITNGSLSAVIVCQIILDSLSALLLYKIAKILFNSNLIGIFAGLAYCIFWDAFRWNTFILTDTFGCFLTVLCTYMLIRYRVNESIKNLLLLLLGVFFLAISRPTALPMLFCVGVVLLFKFRKKARLIIVAACLLVFLAAGTYFIKGSGDRLSISGYFGYFSSLYAHGIIVTGMHEYDYPFITGMGNLFMIVLNYILITIYKLIMFWAIIISRHSYAHKLINLFLFLPLYLFSALGVIQTFRTKNKLNGIIIGIILSYNVFHALTELDYDWRYRLPVIPLLIIIASYGVQVLINFYGYKKNLKNSYTV